MSNKKYIQKITQQKFNTFKRDYCFESKKINFFCILWKYI